MNHYICTCKSRTFHLQEVRFIGSYGRNTKTLLACTECNKRYFIEPCNTTGLECVSTTQLAYGSNLTLKDE